MREPLEKIIYDELLLIHETDWQGFPPKMDRTAIMIRDAIITSQTVVPIEECEAAVEKAHATGRGWKHNLDRAIERAQDALQSLTIWSDYDNCRIARHRNDGPAVNILRQIVQDTKTKPIPPRIMERQKWAGKPT